MQQIRMFHVLAGKPTEAENPVKMFYKYSKEESKTEVWAREGESLLDVAHNNGIDL
eukprot:CAMPEP_0176358230 /NCGR_PEP_ID=MMETSP0126-20121128/15393_1 /TAXON_ID=141414 ORGANISM="Strombidinopsis acuminatum, Strain SPMC142" /NCGR_SAMPLE_ID=MMETSP0126 /ASSEMBLY_ACC=CAM_ASM_000229 /LENGTH=55 /DNA_ID=CAMNT_0017712285 /DNA_START=108 /DNA_END=271 /DNA_ORIENTATION=+